MRFLFPIVSVAALACQPGDTNIGDSATQVRDSAGIRVVENLAPPVGSRLPWRISSEPAVTIGVREGEEPDMLYIVRDALRLDDGRIVVANSGTQEMRVFDETGTHVATWGGRGEGPGEFRSLSAVEPWPGDSIAAWYGPRRGISVFDADGGFGRNFVFERDEIAPPGKPFNPKSIGRGGLILVSHEPHMFERVEVQIRGPQGGIRASLGTHSGDERYIANEGTTRSTMFPRTFGAKAVQVAWGDLFVHASTVRYEIKAFAGDGTLARIVRLDIPPRAPTQAHIDAYIEERVSWYPPELAPDEAEQYVARLRREYQAVPVAEYLPAFASVVADRLDHLWVEHFEAPGEERPGSLWTVFDPDGLVLGFVRTHQDMEIYEIGEDYILGHKWDELGVEYVQVWSLQR